MRSPKDAEECMYTETIASCISQFNFGHHLCNYITAKYLHHNDAPHYNRQMAMERSYSNHYPLVTSMIKHWSIAMVTAYNYLKYDIVSAEA